MKILITGMNFLQCVEDYYLRQDLNVVPTQYALVKCLRDMGHQVDQRPVKIGEDLKEYDKVIAFIHSPAGFARYLYNGLWAIHKRPDCILSIDDWQADSIWEGITRLNADNIFRPYLKDMAADVPEDVEKYKKNLLEAVDIIKAMKNQLVIAAFMKGNISKMVPWYPKHLLNTYHLNPYHLNRRPENAFTGDDDRVILEDMLINPKDKKKEWAFVSLVQNKTRKYLKNMNLSWNVNFFGGMRGEFKSPRLKEPEMCNAYQQHWGCLVPRYYHAGSGFWRPRVFQVADSHSILCVHPDEGMVYSEAHIVNPNDVEQMDLSQLIDLARRQKEGLYDNHPLDKKITRKQLKHILDYE